MFRPKCTSPLNATAIFLGPASAWAEARLELNAVQALWGGQVVRVTGAGEVEVRQRGPIGPEAQFIITLSADETRALFQIFIEQDFLTIAIPFRPGIPDELHPDITLTNAQGATYTVGKWAGQTAARFDAVSAALVTLARRVQ